MEEEPSRWLAETLRARVGESAGAAHVAEVLVSILRDVESALAPTMGQRGVALLYRRSFYLTPTFQPLLVLASPHEGTPTASSASFDALRLMLAQQSSADAVASGTALLQTFYDLLVSLVGLSLAERLLRSVWANYSSGSSALDTSS